MKAITRRFAIWVAVAGLGLYGGAQPSFGAAGSPPNGPIEAVETGANLKFACGQSVDGFKDVVGEETYRWMLIVQCRAVVGAVTELIKAGQYALEDSPRWQCVDIPDNLDELSATFVTWVGRRPALMRAPAAVAFIEAIEMSAPCRDS